MYWRYIIFFLLIQDGILSMWILISQYRKHLDGHLDFFFQTFAHSKSTGFLFGWFFIAQPSKNKEQHLEKKTLNIGFGSMAATAVDSWL